MSGLQPVITTVTNITDQDLQRLITAQSASFCAMEPDRPSYAVAEETLRTLLKERVRRQNLGVWTVLPPRERPPVLVLPLPTVRPARAGGLRLSGYRPLAAVWSCTYHLPSPSESSSPRASAHWPVSFVMIAVSPWAFSQAFRSAGSTPAYSLA